jgi:tetratricopeptide (TPR) repeat protein
LLCVQSGDCETAAADFALADGLLAADDRSGRYVLHAHRGYLALAQSQPARAIEELTQAADLRPDLFDAYTELAEAQVQGKDLDKAVESMDTAIRLKPGAASLYRTRARLQAQRGQLAAALADLDKAVRLTPAPGNAGGPPAPLLKRTMARDHRERAGLLYRLERYPDALLACGAALDCDGTDAAAHRLSGDILLKLKRWKEALQAFDRVPRAQRDPDYYAARARARTELQDFAGAVHEYTHLLEVRETADGFAHRGGAYLDAGAPLLALPDFLDAIRRGSPRGEEFARSTETALQKGPASPELSLRAAQVFAQVAGAVKARANRGHYQNRAVECLMLATAQLPPAEQSSFWTEKVWPERGKSFLPLKSNPAFAQLIEQFVDVRQNKK